MTKLRVVGLNRLQSQSLLKVSDSPFVVEESKLPPGKQGELATAVAVTTLGLAAIRVLAMWLSKKKKKGVIRQTVAIEGPNGVKITRHLEIDLEASESADAQVLKQINAALSEHNLPSLDDKG